MQSAKRFALALKHIEFSIRDRVNGQRVTVLRPAGLQRRAPELTSILFVTGALPRYNGGTKLYNLWVKLLRQNGYQAGLLTADGNYDRWLTDHQPTHSYESIALAKAAGQEVRLVTGWLDVPNFNEIVGECQFFYFDAELRWTMYFRKELDRYLRADRVAGIATHSRYIQSWYMAEYGIRPILINEWSDPAVFYAEPPARVRNRIACMPEEEADHELCDFLRQHFANHEPSCTIVEVSGDESEVAQALRSADLFVGLNPGKHKLWGEGCPRTQQEALHCGCVVVAFDVLGNREYLLDGFTGILVAPGDRTALVAAISRLLKDEAEKSRLRRHAATLAEEMFRPTRKIGLIRDFLYL